MDSILDYFISLQESEPAELPERAIERWNKRADFLGKTHAKKKEKGDERVISAINYLDSKGLLEKIMMSQILDAVPDGLLLHLPNMYTK